MAIPPPPSPRRPHPRSHIDAAELAGPQAHLADLAADLGRVVAGEVHVDAWTRSLYSTDASLYQVTPIAVVVPRATDDMQATLQVARRHGLPVLPRGSGSSLAGQAVGAAIILDTSKHLNRILAIDPDARTVSVQPGVIHAALNRTLAPLGLMLGPDPASAERATLGGCVGNNASGSHSILYGMMADALVAADVLLADGTHTRFAPEAPDALAALARRPGLEGRIYGEVAETIRSCAPEVVAHWPRHWRRASGYPLDRLLAALAPDAGPLPHATRFLPRALPPPDSRLNLAPLLAGSEGTLAICTSLTLRLEARPLRTAVAIVHFDHLLDACSAVTDILELEPSACELLDKQLMDLARAQPEWARKMGFVQGDPAAVLLTEFTGATEHDLSVQIERLEAHLRARGWRGAVVRATAAKEQADLWAVRKAGLNLLTSRRGDFKPVPGIEDVSVPPEHLAAYLEEVMRWSSEQGRDAIADVAVYAHASAGCLHVRPLVNVKTARGVATLAAMAEHALTLCLRYGGAMSGEHGDGLARSALNERLFGPDLYAALRRVKAAFDPEGLLNPGKVVDAPPLSDSLRMGAAYTTIPLAAGPRGAEATVFDWSADGGFAPAVEMCNGAGVCRKLETGVMCPSFMATRDERDSTRGRANALRNALAGRLPHEALFAPEMAEVLDLCLGCKACKSECPSSVDMARIKAEYLVHYHRIHGLPLFNRLMGKLPDLNRALYRWAPGAVPLLNATLASTPFRKLQARVGVSPLRTLPLYAAHPFSQLFVREPETLRPDAPPVLLFHDTWTEANEPEVGLATVRLLHAAGYRVLLAPGRACCGRPLITGGQADKAKPWVDHNVALLAPYAAQGIPIVGIEPSCILTLRDEAPALAADKRRAARVAGAALTLEEFVVREAAAGRFAPRWRPEAGHALLHGHCHTRALVGNEPAVAALQLAGYSVEVIPSGCCGMAGDFGYELDHDAISRTIAEDRLLPAVRAAASDVTIVASGTSCRHQIADLGDRRALHLAQALECALA
jgi:FAD/FMN-containing dehydrogenase/Fe-S oxidoreductase